MNRFTTFVTGHKKSLIAVFFIIAALSVFLMPQVQVNHNLVDYLPKGAESTDAIAIMEDEFGGAIPNARVLINNITLQEALNYKEMLAETEGIAQVSWLDDAVGQNVLKTTPLEFLDKSIVESYYKDDCAVFSITIKSGAEKEAVAAVRSIIGEGNSVAGNAVDIAAAQELSASESTKAMIILVPIILLILIIYTTSWLEPLLFLLSIGVAVLINMGTNVFFEDVSFITKVVSPILQLAVSLDYAIFLLHSFNEFRATCEPDEAMRRAMKKALSAIAASAATTVVGFMALLFMRFEVGPDLGINLVKGVLLSFISVIVFLPAVTLSAYKLIDKTKHRRFLPELKGVGKYLIKISLPLFIVAAIIAVPCYLAQSNMDFQYGTGGVAEATRAGRDAAIISEKFGRENMLVLLVPKGDVGKEKALCVELSDQPNVTGIVSYVSTVGSEIPSAYIDESLLSNFYSENYARIIIYTDLEDESDATFAAMEKIPDTAGKYYDKSYLAGQGATLNDMRNTVSTDTRIVNLIAILGILLVLLLTFKSVSIPLILLFTIETAIWINLSFAYFSGNSYNFIGYLVISTVQLGSTVDYAILMTDRYLENRKQLSKREAIIKTIDGNLIAILISALILSLAGYALAITSTNAIISELGTLLGRGTLLSLGMVACVLPALLVLLDKIIQKTTLQHGFHRSHQDK